MSLDLSQIKAERQRKIDEIGRLQEEVAELDTALRVLERYAEKPPNSEEESGLKPRPPGTPSTFDMVNMVLASAEKEGRTDGLTSRELIDAIGAKYWPGIHRSQILPSIFGFAKNGRLLRNGDKWRRKLDLGL
jgi:hypothetical protein